MFFHKMPAPANFHYPGSFAGRAVDGGLELACDRGRVRVELLADGLVRLRQSLATEHPFHGSVVRHDWDPATGVRCTVEGDRATLTSESVAMHASLDDGCVEVRTGAQAVLRTLPRPFGVSARRQIILFERPEPDAVIYGLGEKTGGLDKSGKAYHFWNVDVVADHPHTFTGDNFDPSYVSIPFVIARNADGFFGVYLNNTGHTWLHTDLRRKSGVWFDHSFGMRAEGETLWAFGADEGALDLFVIPGPTLADVVRRFAMLTGRHEPPPRWALGYHQCRWSYMSTDELLDVSRRLAEARIPTGALWMDIDYMEGFRVFTFDPERFAPEKRRAAFAEIHGRGTRLVTIVDPGVKAEPGYAVFDEGMKRDVFCKTAEGEPFIGVVWPGRTVFPDFSLEEARTFWGEHTARLLADGIDGIWIDMNDPSTGPIDFEEMRFQQGTAEHAAFHNTYADLMARATVEGFRRHDAEARPFVLTRSGCTGTQRHAAIWTGDNASNVAHLALSIPMSLNLALSGVSFNGPDVGGFVGDADEDLFATWFLAGFLFPFLRNHSCTGTRQQEPYAFSNETTELVRQCINTRLKLLPVIETLFHEHAQRGDAVMRPLAWEFLGAEYERIGDQYLLGSHVMLAPFVDLESAERAVVLPTGWWFDMRLGQWIEGGRTLIVPRESRPVLFVRDGAILPCLPGTDFFPQPVQGEVELHVFAQAGAAAGTLVEDDGATQAWKRGELTERRFRWDSADVQGDVRIELLRSGYGGAARVAAVHFYGKAPAKATRGMAAWPFGEYIVHTIR
jgi:alpha-glucosidase